MSSEDQRHGRWIGLIPRRVGSLLGALARALATAVVPFLAWRSMRRRRKGAVPHCAQAELLAYLHCRLQRSDLVRQIELAGYRLRASPALKPRARRRHGIGDVLSLHMGADELGGRSVRRYGTSSAGEPQEIPMWNGRASMRRLHAGGRGCP